MKQLYKITFLFVLTQFPMSCIINCKDDDDPVNAEITAIDSEFVYFSDINGHREHTGTATLLHTDAALRIYVEDLNYIPVANNWSFSLISGAYACSPAPNVIFEQQIDEIAIVAEDAFTFLGLEFQAGDTVNHIFRVRNFESASLNDFIAEQNSYPAFFGEIGSDLFLQLDGTVTDPIRANFNVSITFKDEVIHQTATPEYRVH
ncbi:MAG: hypothetical protein R8G66_04475 [Cytophagales bacterium]|nr:hypothetical protein [Cytophagales bacterium]